MLGHSVVTGRVDLESTKSARRAVVHPCDISRSYIIHSFQHHRAVGTLSGDISEAIESSESSQSLTCHPHATDNGDDLRAILCELLVDGGRCAFVNEPWERRCSACKRWKRISSCARQTWLGKHRSALCQLELVKPDVFDVSATFSMNLLEDRCRHVANTNAVSELMNCFRE